VELQQEVQQAQAVMELHHLLQVQALHTQVAVAVEHLQQVLQVVAQVVEVLEVILLMELLELLILVVVEVVEVLGQLLLYM
jgi:hypothetical protein